MFTEFERDEDAEVGVMFRDFITAISVYVYTNEGARSITVADIATAFNTTPDLVREAVGGSYWLHSAHSDDPAQQFVESDGE